MEYKLQVPFRVLDGNEISSIKIRDNRTVGDLLAVERKGGGSHERDVTLVARLTGLDESEIMSIDADRDWPVIVKIIEDNISRQLARAAEVIAQLPGHDGNDPKAGGLPAHK